MSGNKVEYDIAEAEKVTLLDHNYCASYADTDPDLIPAPPPTINQGPSPTPKSQSPSSGSSGSTERMELCLENNLKPILSLNLYASDYYNITSMEPKEEEMSFKYVIDDLGLTSVDYHNRCGFLFNAPLRQRQKDNSESKIREASLQPNEILLSDAIHAIKLANILDKHKQRGKLTEL